LQGVSVLADFEVPAIADGVTGANEADRHYTGVAYERDFRADKVLDLRNVQNADPCPRCPEGHLEHFRGIEVGNTFMLGTKYSEALGALFLDEAGAERPCVMGSYGIGITRTAQAAVEAFHDEAGMIWPWNLAPYQVLLLPLNVRKAPLMEACESLYIELEGAGFEVLMDDRDERGGVKFNDADLIGIPVQVILGERGLGAGKVEVKVRKSGERREVPIPDLLSYLRELAGTLSAPVGPQAG